MEMSPSIAAVIAVSLLVAVVLTLWLTRRPRRVPPLPTEWALTARPVFSTDERRVHKLLREALPHHIVLSKLPLVRFSQPSDPAQVRFWYDLLGSTNVTFAVCSANGRVLAAIDLDTDRGNSRRILQIKQSVLGACRIRYLRCPVDNLPSAAELQLLVPSSTAAAARSPQPAGAPRDIDEVRDSLASTVATRRAQRTALWQDSSLFQDSFFAPDSRQDSGQGDFVTSIGSSGRSAARQSNGHERAASRDDGDAGRAGRDAEPIERGGNGESRRGSEEIAGVVVDSAAALPARSRH